MITNIQDLKKTTDASLDTERKASGKMEKSFVSVVCHDLKSPLGTIAMSADLLMAEINSKNVESDLTQYVEMIQRTTGSMFALIEELLDCGQIESGKLTLKREPADIVELIKSTMTMFEPQYLKKGVILSCDLPSKSVIVVHDKHRFSQVISNLLSNALKFTTQGFVTVELKDDDQQVEIVVKDTGPGIPKRDMETIFERHSQVDSRREGSGLGLYIAKWIVDLHKGNIWAADGVSLGSEFHVTLPKNYSPDAEA